MEYRAFQFPLTTFFAFAFVVSLCFGAGRIVLEMQQRAVRDARLQALERILAENGGRVIGYAKNSSIPVCIDVSKAHLEPELLETILKIWDYTDSRTLVIDNEAAVSQDISDLQKRFPVFRFVVELEPIKRFDKGDIPEEQ